MQSHTTLHLVTLLLPGIPGIGSYFGSSTRFLPSYCAKCNSVLQSFNNYFLAYLFEQIFFRPEIPEAPFEIHFFRVLAFLFEYAAVILIKNKQFIAIINIRCGRLSGDFIDH